MALPVQIVSISSSTPNNSRVLDEAEYRAGLQSLSTTLRAKCDEIGANYARACASGTSSENGDSSSANPRVPLPSTEGDLTQEHVTLPIDPSATLPQPSEQTNEAVMDRYVFMLSRCLVREIS